MALQMTVDEGVIIAPALKTRLRREIGRMVHAVALSERRKDVEVAVRLCTDATIRELNRDYRDIDKPTDVLAFAQREAANADRSVLGDIVISVETANRQAKQGLHAELLHLASHGLCHLLGYDHQSDADEHVMNARASALRREAVRLGRVRAA